MSIGGDAEEEGLRGREGENEELERGREVEGEGKRWRGEERRLRIQARIFKIGRRVVVVVVVWQQTVTEIPIEDLPEVPRRLYLIH
jgi:hypothetical protein